jgi:hypothetical protein
MRNNLRKSKKRWVDAWTAFVTLLCREACLAYRVAIENLNRIVSKWNYPAFLGNEGSAVLVKPHNSNSRHASSSR